MGRDVTSYASRLQMCHLGCLEPVRSESLMSGNHIKTITVTIDF